MKTFLLYKDEADTDTDYLDAFFHVVTFTNMLPHTVIT